MTYYFIMNHMFLPVEDVMCLQLRTCIYCVALSEGPLEINGNVRPGGESGWPHFCSPQSHLILIQMLAIETRWSELLDGHREHNIYMLNMNSQFQMQTSR